MQHIAWDKLLQHEKGVGRRNPQDPACPTEEAYHPLPVPRLSAEQVRAILWVTAERVQTENEVVYKVTCGRHWATGMEVVVR